MTYNGFIQDTHLAKRRMGEIYDVECPNVSGKNIPVLYSVEM